MSLSIPGHFPQPKHLLWCSIHLTFLWDRSPLGQARASPFPPTVSMVTTWSFLTCAPVCVRVRVFCNPLSLILSLGKVEREAEMSEKKHYISMAMISLMLGITHFSFLVFSIVAVFLQSCKGDCCLYVCFVLVLLCFLPYICVLLGLED